MTHRTAANALPPLPTPEEMRLWDGAAIALGLPEMLLMENAARAALAALRRHMPLLRGKRALCFMGGGNNGGDAACLARLLHAAGAQVLVLHTSRINVGTGAARRHARVAKACGVTFRPVPARTEAFLKRLDARWQTPDIIIDGLLGTGFTGQLRSPTDVLVDYINVCAQRPQPPFILALDTPSGLDCMKGRPAPIAVRAAATVCFAAAKPGLMLPEAREYTGLVHVWDIGIPPHIQTDFPASYRVLDASCAALLPPPPVAAHKNAFGHVLLLAGSEGLTGAAHLAARAALRSGAGLVSAAGPATLLPEVKAGLPDIITVPLGSSGGSTWPSKLPANLLDVLRRTTALAVGPGMGQSLQAGDLLEHLLALPDRPAAVLDADALNILASRPGLLDLLRPEDICTPHPGEAARLLGTTSLRIQEDRMRSVRALAALAPCCWGLKGAGTLLLRQGGPVIIAPYDVPSLSVAGSGDVLTGCAAALLARNMDSLTVAALATAAHVQAGRLLLERFPRRGNLASDMADILPHAWASLNTLPDYAARDHFPEAQC